MPPPLVLHAGALGDLVLTIQFAMRLPALVRAESIDLFSRADPGDLSHGFPALRRRSLESLGADWLYAEEDQPSPKRWRALTQGRFVLNTLGGFGSRVHRRLELLKPAGLVSVDPRPRGASRLHITEQWAEQLLEQGVRVAALRSYDAGTFRGDASEGKPIVVIHPGSGDREKCWPLAGFVELGRRCLNAGHRVVFVLGEVEHDRWSPEQFEQVVRDFEIVDMPRPDELAALLASADVFVGNDSGPTHLAALIGTPVVAVFGPTEPEVWRPLGRSVRVVRGSPASEGGRWGLTPADVDQIVRGVATRPARS